MVSIITHGHYCVETNPHMNKHIKRFNIFIGKETLSELTHKYLKIKHDDAIFWLIDHWNDLLACKTALSNLRSYVTGL